jgi:hypothetical protein
MNHSRETFRGTTHRSANPQKALALLSTLLAVSWGVRPLSLKLDARPQASLQAVTDRITYNAGDQVGLRIVSPTPEAGQTRVRYLFAVRYAGEAKPVADGLVLGSAEGASPGYRSLWKVPPNARAGR